MSESTADPFQWQVVSKPDAIIEVRQGTIPPHIQALISANLELGRKRRESESKKITIWQMFLKRIGLGR